MKKGFSIIEILIAAALLTLLVLGFTQYLGGALKGQKNVQNAVDFDILKTSLNLVLNTQACNGAFQTPSNTPVVLSLPSGMTWSSLSVGPPATIIISPNATAPATSTPLPVSQVVQGGSPVAKIQQSLGGGMTLAKLEFTTVTYDGDQTLVTDTTTTPPTTTTYHAFLAQLHVGVTKQTSSLGASGYDSYLTVRMLVNPGTSSNQGTVERCAGSAAPSQVYVSSPIPLNSMGTFGSSASTGAHFSYTVPNPFPGATEINVIWYFVCTAANNGWQVGDEFPMLGNYYVNSYVAQFEDANGFTITRDAAIQFQNKTIGGGATSSYVPDPAQWALRYVVTAQP